MKDREGREPKPGDVYYWGVTGQFYTIEVSKCRGFKDFRFRNQYGNLTKLKVSEFNLLRMVRVVKGVFTTNCYGNPAFFECSECDCTTNIAADPAEEAPNYCFNCGLRFDWRGVYEEYLKQMERVR